jgi:small subunit ribosomal protein S1
MEESNVLFDQQAEEETQTEDALNEQESMEALLEQEGLGIDFPKVGETRTGVIASVSESEILVSVGAKSEGIISGREFDQIDSETRAEFKTGLEIPVYVLSLEDKNGNLILSFNRAKEEMDWDNAEGLQESEEVYESKVIGYNKGGLIVGMGRLRGFVPASQIGLSRRMSITGDTPEKRYSKIVGEPVSVRVIEVDRTRRRLILSERMALKETRESLKERLLDDLEIGDRRTGRVTSLADFGAFVNIEGADGLVHMSEISWERIQSPKEVLKVGQEVDVEVISIDRERKRIGLSIRRLQENPWLKKVEHLQEGQLIEATITHLTKFGAFARLGDADLEGLIHVSELSTSRVEHPKEVVSEGDTVTLRIIKIDKERQRIGLSLRKVDSAAYADLDWKMLRNEIDGATEEDSLEEEVSMEMETVEEEPVEEEPVAEEPVEEEPIEETTSEGETVAEEPVEEEPVEEEPVAEEPVEETISEGETFAEEPVEEAVSEEEPLAEESVGEASEEEPDPEGDLEPNEDDHPQED